MIYRKKSGGSRSIYAMVDREPPARVDSAGRVWTPKMEITVRNDATAGIIPSELDNGGDAISVAYRRGGQTDWHPIRGEPVTQDAGMIRLMIS